MNDAGADLQPELFDRWHLEEPNKTRTLDLYDVVPKFLLTRNRQTTGSKLHRWNNVKVGTRELAITLKAAALVDESDSRKVRFVYPGIREELIERSLRKMAVDRSAEIGLDVPSGSVTVAFSVRGLRNRLARDGHDFSAPQLRDGLEVMSGCELTIEGRIADDLSDRLRGPLLAIRRDIRWKTDRDGNKSLYLGMFHPLATHSILGQDYRSFGHRVVKLRLPLARWIATTMNVRFRQATKGFGVRHIGYTLSLSRILDQSGMLPEKRVRDSVDRVRKAIRELESEGYLGGLSAPQTKEEKRYKSSGSGRPGISDVHWTLYPSSTFAAEIIAANVERAWGGRKARNRN